MKFGANVVAVTKRAKIAISAMNILFRPNRSARLPSAVAPTRMPANDADEMKPCWVVFREKSIVIRGRATPVMKIMMPSKNLPAAASHQIRHCIPVIGGIAVSVPSRQRGLSSMYSWTVRPGCSCPDNMHSPHTTGSPSSTGTARNSVDSTGRPLPLSRRRALREKSFTIHLWFIGSR